MASNPVVVTTIQATTPLKRTDMDDQEHAIGIGINCVDICPGYEQLVVTVSRMGEAILWFVDVSTSTGKRLKQIIKPNEPAKEFTGRETVLSAITHSGAVHAAFAPSVEDDKSVLLAVLIRAADNSHTVQFAKLLNLDTIISTQLTKGCYATANPIHLPQESGGPTTVEHGGPSTLVWTPSGKAVFVGGVQGFLVKIAFTDVASAATTPPELVRITRDGPSVTPTPVGMLALDEDTVITWFTSVLEDQTAPQWLIVSTKSGDTVGKSALESGALDFIASAPLQRGCVLNEGALLPGLRMGKQTAAVGSWGKVLNSNPVKVYKMPQVPPFPQMYNVPFIVRCSKTSAAAIPIFVVLTSCAKIYIVHGETGDIREFEGLAQLAGSKANMPPFWDIDIACSAAGALTLMVACSDGKLCVTRFPSVAAMVAGTTARVDGVPVPPSAFIPSSSSIFTGPNLHNTIQRFFGTSDGWKQFEALMTTKGITEIGEASEYYGSGLDDLVDGTMVLKCPYYGCCKYARSEGEEIEPSTAKLICSGCLRAFHNECGIHMAALSFGQRFMEQVNRLIECLSKGGEWTPEATTVLSAILDPRLMVPAAEARQSGGAGGSEAYNLLLKLAKLPEEQTKNLLRLQERGRYMDMSTEEKAAVVSILKRIKCASVFTYLDAFVGFVNTEDVVEQTLTAQMVIVLLYFAQQKRVKVNQKGKYNELIRTLGKGASQLKSVTLSDKLLATAKTLITEDLITALKNSALYDMMLQFDFFRGVYLTKNISAKGEVSDLDASVLSSLTETAIFMRMVWLSYGIPYTRPMLPTLGRTFWCSVCTGLLNGEITDPVETFFKFDSKIKFGVGDMDVEEKPSGGKGEDEDEDAMYDGAIMMAAGSRVGGGEDIESVVSGGAQKKHGKSSKKKRGGVFTAVELKTDMICAYGTMTVNNELARRCMYSIGAFDKYVVYIGNMGEETPGYIAVRNRLLQNMNGYITAGKLNVTTMIKKLVTNAGKQRVVTQKGIKQFAQEACDFVETILKEGAHVLTERRNADEEALRKLMIPLNVAMDGVVQGCALHRAFDLEIRSLIAGLGIEEDRNWCVKLLQDMALEVKKQMKKCLPNGDDSENEEEGDGGGGGTGGIDIGNGGMVVPDLADE